MRRVPIAGRGQIQQPSSCVTSTISGTVHLWQWVHVTQFLMMMSAPSIAAKTLNWRASTNSWRSTHILSHPCAPGARTSPISSRRTSYIDWMRSSLTRNGSVVSAPHCQSNSSQQQYRIALCLGVDNGGRHQQCARLPFVLLCMVWQKHCSACAYDVASHFKWRPTRCSTCLSAPAYPYLDCMRVLSQTPAALPRPVATQ